MFGIKKDNPLLPNTGLPPFPYFPANGCVEWLEGTEDIEKRYIENGGHSVYGAHDIKYEFNSLGYRSPEFDEKADITIVAIGCSYVMGVGLPKRDLFHEQFAERLRMATSKKVVVFNIGIPGASNDYITRMLYLAVPYLKPHIVLINFTHIDRREYISIQREWIRYVPNYIPTNAVAREISHHFESLSSPFQDDLNLFINYQALKFLLSDRFWLFSAINESGFERIKNHIDFERYAGVLREFDKARDWLHPGPKSHSLLGENYWKKFQSGDGVRIINQMISQ